MPALPLATILSVLSCKGVDYQKSGGVRGRARLEDPPPAMAQGEGDSDKRTP